MRTIVMIALLSCFATVAHAGQQITPEQLNTLIRAQQLAQTTQQLENLRAAQQQNLVLKRIQRQQRLQQWNDSFYDLSMLIEASRTRRAVEALAVPAAPTLSVEGIRPVDGARSYMTEAERKSWAEFWVQWDTDGKKAAVSQHAAPIPMVETENKACPFWRKTCWKR